MINTTSTYSLHFSTKSRLSLNLLQINYKIIAFLHFVEELKIVISLIRNGLSRL